MARELNKKTLSKGILEMKFMKKTREKIEKEIVNTDGHDEMYSNNITSKMRKVKTIYVSEPSIMACEDLREGRLSFGGVNPDIEKIMEDERKKEGITEQDADVSDVQLAKFYSENKEKLNPNLQQQKYIVKNKRKLEHDLQPRIRSSPLYPNPNKKVRKERFRMEGKQKRRR